MNFNNWFSTIRNAAVAETGKEFAVLHYGPTGVFLKSNAAWIGPAKCHNLLVLLDFEPMWASTADQFDRPLHAPYEVIIVHSCANDRYSDNTVQRPRCHIFSHALIARDWFREHQFYREHHIVGQKTNKHAFVCLNHLVGGTRNYRLLLMSRLYERGLTNDNLVSHGRFSNGDKSSLLPPEEYQRIVEVRDAVHLDLNDEQNFSSASANINMPLLNSAFLNVVTETCFYENFNHLTEKIFKPIVMMQPFILVGTYKSLAYLRQYGFKTFNRWIDESYDEVKNPFKRLDMITAEIEKICSLTPDERNALYEEMLPVLEHNRRHFYGAMYDMVVDEFCENLRAVVKKGP